MKTLFCLAFAAATLAAPVGEVTLVVQHRPEAVEFSVGGPATPYFAGVLLALAPDLAHYFTALPPLLADHVTAGAGFVEQGSYRLSLAATLLPPGIMIYAQGVTFDGAVFGASAVDCFVFDVTGEH